jgi:hypothetical protein
VQGRPHTLSVNYRISEEEARTYADRLSRSLAEVDAKREEGVLSSLLRGPAPMVSIFRDSIAEREVAGLRIAERSRDAALPDKIAGLVCSSARGRAR